MLDGCLIRELPDGGREFVLDEPLLGRISIDDRVTLQFGRTELVIEGPFEVVVDGEEFMLDSRRRDELGPLLALYPGTALWLWTSSDGRLRLVFENGSRVSVGPRASGPAWAVGSVADLDDASA